MQKAPRHMPVTASKAASVASRQGTGKVAKSLPAVPVQFKENKTGMPDGLKKGVEHLSGMGMNDVRVHYNSGKPAQLQAFAFAQGTDIHIAPGQEKHLPHEAWHVVQQKQGRVQPTMQMKDGKPVNDALFQLARSMEKINEDQQVLEESDNLNGKYTSVGLEWNLVELNPKNYLLAGMSHIEIADSSQESLGVKHKLETEAGNRIEYVAPPYLVCTKEQGETEPDYLALTELIQAQLTALEQVIGNAKTLRDLMGVWPSFNIKMAPHENLGEHISSRNWSMKTKKSYGNVMDELAPQKELKNRKENKKKEYDSDEEVRIRIDDTSEEYNSNEEIRIIIDNSNEEINNSNELVKGGNSWLDATIDSRLLSVEKDYQINVLSDAKTYEGTYSAKQSRINTWSNPKDLKAFDNLATEFCNTLHIGIPNGPFLDLLPGLTLFHKQFGRVLVQHGVVPLLKKLRNYQGQKAQDPISINNEDAREFSQVAEDTSYIKDMANVWLKTDLLDYGKGLLKSKDDWAVEAEVLANVKDAIVDQVNGNNVFPTDESKEAMLAFFTNITSDIHYLTQEDDIELALGSSTKQIERRQHGPGELFEHSNDIFGVRQDTFINPENINKLNKKLGLNNQALFVMEQRNPEQYREYLRKKQFSYPGYFENLFSEFGLYSTEIEPGMGYKLNEDEKKI